MDSVRTQRCDAEYRSTRSGSIPLLFQLLAILVGIPAIVVIVHFSHDDFFGMYFFIYSSAYSGIVGLLSLALAFRSLQKPDGSSALALLAFAISVCLVLQAGLFGVPRLLDMLF